MKLMSKGIVIGLIWISCIAGATGDTDLGRAHLIYGTLGPVSADVCHKSLTSNATETACTFEQYPAIQDEMFVKEPQADSYVADQCAVVVRWLTNGYKISFYSTDGLSSLALKDADACLRSVMTQRDFGVQKARYVLRPGA